MFATERGQPLNGSAVTRDFKATLVAAGLKPLRFHDLRHGAATLMLAQGVEARTVMDVLGHTQISTTMNVYAHVIPPRTGGTSRFGWTGC